MTDANSKAQPTNSKQYRRIKVEQKQEHLARKINNLKNLVDSYGYHCPVFNRRKLEPCRVRPAKFSAVYPHDIWIVEIETIAGQIINPAMLISSSIDLSAGAIYYSDVYVGGQIRAIRPTKLLLPESIREVAQSEVHEHRMNTWSQLIVSIDSEWRYVVEAFSFYARWGEKMGSAVDCNIWKLRHAYDKLRRPELILPDPITTSWVLISNVG